MVTSMIGRYLTASLWFAVACGDDSRGLERDTLDSADLPDTATPRDTVVVTEVAPTPDTRAPDDITVTPDIVTTTDSADTVPPPDTTAVDTPSEVVLPKLGDACDAPWILADDDGDRHFDALGNVGPLGKLADDFDATTCGITDTTLNGAGTSDELWRFTAPAAGRYLVGLLSDTSIDLVLYVLDGTECSAACLGFDDSGGVGDIDQLTLTLSAGQAITVVVDGKSTAHAGAYLVDVYACTSDECLPP